MGIKTGYQPRSNTALDAQLLYASLSDGESKKYVDSLAEWVAQNVPTMGQERARELVLTAMIHQRRVAFRGWRSG